MRREFLTPEVQELALSLMAGLNCPRSLMVSILIRSAEWDQLVRLKVDPAHYDSPDRYLRAAGATEFLRKLNRPIEGNDPEQATFDKWLAAEESCFKTNQRLNEIMDFGTLNGDPVHDEILEFIADFRKNFEWLVGSGPGPHEGNFGPGATISDKSGYTTVPHKLSSTPSFTPGALYHLVPWTGTKWARACAHRGDVLRSVRGNTYFTVNKTALVKRPCAKGASVNAFYQAGQGRVMRKRLFSRGINLSDGQNVHKQVACVASFNDEFCTIDLTSASDTVARALVRLACSPAWFNELDSLAERFTKVGSRWYRLEKFSSMGNGFTFELETALFCAICMSCDPLLTPGHNLWVYGDDIIVPKRLAAKVISALKFFGFTPNPDKTYVSGDFRESCGGDFFRGMAVRPFYLEEIPNEPQDYISLANGIRRLASNFGQSSRLFADLRKCWFKCLDYIPSHIRQCRGPEQLGDIVIHDSEERWRTRWRANCIRYVRVYRPIKPLGVRFDRFDPTVQFAAALYGVSFIEKPSGDQRTKLLARWGEYDDRRTIPLRDSVTGYKVGWVPFS